MKNKLLICNEAKKCRINTCVFHKIPHEHNYSCNKGLRICNNKKTECIPYKSKKSAKRYSLKQLYSLWIEWAEKYNISCQKFYEEDGLPGSFITWLEEREKNEKSN